MGKKDFKIHSIKYNLIMNIILKISAFLFPLITFPYVSRVLMEEANGKIAFAAASVNYFALFAMMGIPSYGVRRCAEYRDDRQKLAQTVCELLLINAVCVLITYTIFLISVLTIPKFRSETVLMLVSSLTIIFNMLGTEWFYQAIEQYQYITVRNIAFKFIAIALMFIFVHSPKDYIIYAGITIVGTVGSNILNFIRIHRYITLKPTEKLRLKRHIQPIFVLFLYNAATTIFTNLDQVMLGFMSTDAQGGYYAAAVKIKNILVSVITALGAVMLPRVTYYLKQGKKSEFETLIVKSFEFIFISAIPIAVFFVAEASPIIRFLGGERYIPSISVMQALMAAIVFIGLSSVTAWQLLIPLGLEKYTVLGAVFGAVTDLVLNALLIPKLGALGAAIGTAFAEGAVLLTHVIVLWSTVKKTFDIPEFFKACTASAVAVVPLVMLNSTAFFNKMNVFWECCVVGMVFFVLYGILLIVLKEKIVWEALRSVSRR